VGPDACREDLPVTHLASTRGAAALLTLAFLAIGAARGDEPAPAAPGPGSAPAPEPASPAPAAWRFGGECFASGALEQFHDVSIRAVDVRLGVGGRQPGQRLLGLEGVELGVLFTVGGQIGSTAHGLPVKAGRLGAGVRGRSGRLTAGLDAEAILLVVTRQSTSGELRGTGFLARVQFGLDLLQFEGSALYLGLEGSLAAIGSSDDRYLPAAQGGLGFRW
jgi:hypothetical protein